MIRSWFRRRAPATLATLLVTVAPAAHAQSRVQSEQTSKRSTVTFAEDIAPILFQHCASCHRPNGSASFSLLSYEDARGRARQLAAVTASRAMPPWQPEPGHGEFEGNRRLTDQQIAVFRQWVDQGLAEGDAARLPPAPEWTSDWQLGEPDLVLTTPRYTLRGDGPDRFRNFVVPVPGDLARYVRAWEFRPGNARVVHHATMQIDPGGVSRRLDDQDTESGYEGLIAPSARAPDGFFLDWAPGHRANVSTEGTAWVIPGGADLVMMLHLRPSGKEETVQASVGLYFTSTPPTRQPAMLRLTQQRLDIPAGAQRYEVSDSYTLPVAAEVHTVQPHAHYLAREMHGFARLPDGTTKELIYIRHWDFNWQDVYRYATPIALPPGATLVMRYTYDNSPDNPRNPTRPPRRVRYGQQTSDEMAELWFQVVARNREERARLQASLYAKILPEEVAGHRVMLEADPGNIALRDDLALMLVESGDLAGALKEFKQTLALNPESAAARYNVGFALLAAGQPAAARSFFEQALKVDATHARAHDGLGRVLQASGDLAAALGHYREAVRLNPGDAAMLLNAGVALGLGGLRVESIAHLRRALEARPDWPNAQAALAWVLAVPADASASEREEAVRLADRAVAGTNRSNAAFLDILATALASAGQFDRAIATARLALEVSATGRDQAQTAAIRERLQLFERRQIYSEPRN
jgi:tetratricopeptide (TPR) repeat protein/mono/diheme cytochrome c family protein